jgi:hypothetical protein
MPIALAHGLAKQLAAVRKNGTLPYLRPDGKSQVTVEYRYGVPTRVDTNVIAAQHDAQVSQEQLRAEIREHVVNKVIPANMLDANTRYFINSTGRFVIAGGWATLALGPQDHRGYLWRHDPPRRRRLFGQRPHEGGPLRCLCGALGGQKRGGRRLG